MRTGRGVLMCWFVVTACANEDVVLFDFRGGGAAGASGMQSVAGMGGAPNGGGAASVDASTAGAPDRGTGDVTGASPLPSCESNGDCPYGWSCEKAYCTDVTGTCITRPICSDQTLDVVCGCDGVTYWNDCLRKRAGQASSTKRQCDIDAKQCHGAADCGSPDSVCGRLFPADACNEGMFGQHGPGPDPQGNQPPPGTCWSIPQNCDAATDTFGWIECGAAAPMTCLDTCEALSTGRFFVRSASGSCP